MSKNKLSYWKNHPGSAILRLLVWLSAIITVAVMAFLVGFILIKGVGNLTQTEVAKKMGMSQVQISRMEKRILKKLREMEK